ncbi:oxygen-independent coproporphyrinogen III oxidase [Anaeromyxobacter sp. PSR-1]|uniref:oxygen-independent coproporphyrinogen III oxidase n=1 Tax=unclassified Anaeromyxobacter TaxID=2620896 RepID=UPI0005DCA98D|nr:oxygen-independent coproporphyrinogen III oxidase [Anaeromyxobacter sp. PSR-1]GAO03104.1 oxygen-independent coproporphyrinogen-III oxidase [Anaeromyxobacter sp. PSR-1]
MIQIPSTQLIKKYDRPGPRYTSYPTAPEWTEAFGPAQYVEHLARANQQGGPLSIYVHLPFCREMCRFCGCNVVATHDRTRADAYLDVLEKEVALVAAKLPDRRAASQLHWGGGTPTFLDEKQLVRCHDILARHFTFTSDAEKAIEIDPAITTRSQIEVLAKLGFNRISMGVQDFDARVQEVVGRIQGEKETADLVQAARDNGFKGVNLDLIYGLPYQTPDTWKKTLERILAIHPDRMAVFGFAYVPWSKPHQRLLPQEALPKTEQRVELFLSAVEAFTGAGYRLIGLDHFALESDELAVAQSGGYLYRNFQGYTVRPADDTVAFGMTSISDIGGAYAQNAHKLKDWEAKVDAGVIPVDRGASMSADDVMRRFTINRVMCLLRLDLREIAEKFGPEGRAAIEADLRAGVKELEDDGLVTFDGDVLKVTPLGQLLVRNVAMLFDAYLKKEGGKKQFSRTV